MTAITGGPSPSPAPCYTTSWHSTDLYGCDPTSLVDAEGLERFVEELCDEVLQMKRFGGPFIEWFGSASVKAAGYSLVQLIETSSVVGHFSPARGSAHLDVFSCARFDDAQVAEFCSGWFASESQAVMTTTRH